MATPLASYRKPQPTDPSFVERVHNYLEAQAPHAETQPVKFDADFLERRMQAHREMQDRYAADLATGIILEVAIALDEVQ